MFLAAETMKLGNFIKRLIREEDGPTAVEYAVMLALIIGVIIASVTIFGGATGTLFGDISDNIEAITP